MKAERISFYVYAATPEKAAELESELHDIIVSMYERGVAVTAERLTGLLKKYKTSPLLPIILNNG